MKHAIERAARLAEGIVLQRDKLPPSVLERDVERAFGPVARQLGGHFDRVKLALDLGDENGVLEAWVEHVRGSEWRTRFELSLERRLVPNLRIADSRHASAWTSWHEPDLRVGDAAFDAAFIVRGERGDVARAALTPEVRAALLALRLWLDRIKLEDGRLAGRVDRVLSDSRTVERAAMAVLAVGEAFALTRRTRSAYR